MSEACVKQIFIGSQIGGEIKALDAVEAVQFSGLRGDRYFKPGNLTAGNREAITLIDTEQIRLCNDQLQSNFSAADFRRNIVTDGIDLNKLVGAEFIVGEARLRGYELCQPCKYLSNMLQVDLLLAMLDRGGLRAEIVESGTIRVGDKIRLLEQEHAQK